MEPLKKKMMREKLTKMIGDSEAGKEMIEIILKANFEGYTQEEIENYKKQKEEEVEYFKERLDLGISSSTESKTINNE